MTEGICSSRMRKLFNSTYGKSIIIPMDHGFYAGNIRGLEDPYSITELLIEEGVDATIMSLGMGKITNALFTERNVPAKILSIDYLLFSNIPGEHRGIQDYELFFTIEQALKWGFDAIKVLLAWGLDMDLQMKEIERIGRIVSECDRWDMPLMIEPVLWGSHIPPEKRNEPDAIAHTCRIAAEMGADVLKIPYTGSIEHFRGIVEKIRLPIVILGGADMSSNEQVLRTARDSVIAGGRGIAFGRSVWQSGKIRALIRALKDVVYEETEVSEALQNLEMNEAAG
jgi:class I fructose-bisphosphate aldolase